MLVASSSNASSSSSSSNSSAAASSSSSAATSSSDSNLKTSPAALENDINTAYWYQDEDMQLLMPLLAGQYQQQFIGHTDISIAPPLDNISHYGLDNYLGDEKKEATADKPRLIWLVYNKGISHWVAMVLYIDKDKCKQAYYIDSLSNSTTAPTRLQQDLAQQYPDAKLTVQVDHKQTDSVSCGPLALENLVLMTHKINETKPIVPRMTSGSFMAKVRHRHVQLSLPIQQTLPTYQTFYYRQWNNQPAILSLTEQLQVQESITCRLSAREIKTVKNLRTILAEFSEKSERGKRIIDALGKHHHQINIEGQAYLNGVRGALVTALAFPLDRALRLDADTLKIIVETLFKVPLDEALINSDDPEQWLKSITWFKSLDFCVDFAVLQAIVLPPGTDEIAWSSETNTKLEELIAQQKSTHEHSSKAEKVCATPSWATMSSLILAHNASEGDEKEAYRRVLIDCIDEYARTQKTWQSIQTILALVDSENESIVEDSIYQHTLTAFSKSSERHSFLEMVGLAWLIANAPPTCLDATLLADIFSAYVDKLPNLKTNEEQTILAVYNVINRTLEVLHQVGGIKVLKYTIKKAQKGEPDNPRDILADGLGRFKASCKGISSDVAFQSAYAKQAYLHLKSTQSKGSLAWRNTKRTGQGLTHLGVASAHVVLFAMTGKLSSLGSAGKAGFEGVKTFISMLPKELKGHNKHWYASFVAFQEAVNVTLAENTWDAFFDSLQENGLIKDECKKIDDLPAYLVMGMIAVLTQVMCVHRHIIPESAAQRFFAMLVIYYRQYEPSNIVKKFAEKQRKGRSSALFIREKIIRSLLTLQKTRDDSAGQFLQTQASICLKDLTELKELTQEKLREIKSKWEKLHNTISDEIKLGVDDTMAKRCYQTRFPQDISAYALFAALKPIIFSDPQEQEGFPLELPLNAFKKLRELDSAIKEDSIKLSPYGQRLVIQLKHATLTYLQKAMIKWYCATLQPRISDNKAIDVRQEDYVELAVVNPKEQQSSSRKVVAKHHTEGGYEHSSLYHLPASHEEIYYPKRPITLPALFNQEAAREISKEALPSESLLFLGRAGIGKTVFSTHVAWYAHYRQHVGWVLLLRCRDMSVYLSHHEVNTIPILLHTLWWNKLGLSVDDAVWLWAELNKTGCLFVLDGYDELHIDDSKNPDAPLVISNILKHRTFITSRPYGLSSKITYTTLELLGFGGKQMQRYVNTCFDEVNSNDLLKVIHNYPMVRTLGHIPLHLDLLCAIWQRPSSHGTLKQTKTSTILYYQLLIELLRRHLIDKKTVEKVEAMNDDQVWQDDLVTDPIDFLSTLAFRHFVHGDGSIWIQAEQARQWLKEWNDEKKQARGKLPSLTLVKALGVGWFQGPPGAAKYGVRHQRRSTEAPQAFFTFPHLSFEEYLTAYYMAIHFDDDSIKETITKHKYNPRFQHVWWFLSGKLNSEDEKRKTKQLHDYFSLLLAEPRDLLGLYETRLFAGCLGESGQFSNIVTEHPELLTQIDGWLNQGMVSHEGVILTYLIPLLLVYPHIFVPYVWAKLKALCNTSHNVSANVFTMLITCIECQTSLVDETTIAWLLDKLNTKKHTQYANYISVISACLSVRPDLLSNSEICEVIKLKCYDSHEEVRPMAFAVYVRFIVVTPTLIKNETLNIIIMNLENSKKQLRDGAFLLFKGFLEHDKSLANQEVIDRILARVAHILPRKLSLRGDSHERALKVCVETNPDLANKKSLDEAIKVLSDEDIFNREFALMKLQAFISVRPAFINSDIINILLKTRSIFGNYAYPSILKVCFKSRLDLLNSDVIDIILSYFNDESWGIKERALKMLRICIDIKPNLINKIMVEHILARIEDPDIDVRVAAARTLDLLFQKIPDFTKKVFDTIMRRYNDDKRLVRGQVATSLNAFLFLQPSFANDTILKRGIERLRNPELQVRQEGLLTVASCLLAKPSLPSRSGFVPAFIASLEDSSWLTDSGIRLFEDCLEAQPVLAKEKLIAALLEKLSCDDLLLKQKILKLIQLCIKGQRKLVDEALLVAIEAQLGDSDVLVRCSMLNLLDTCIKLKPLLATEKRANLYVEMFKRVLELIEENSPVMRSPTDTDHLFSPVIRRPFDTNHLLTPHLMSLIKSCFEADPSLIDKTSIVTYAVSMLSNSNNKGDALQIINDCIEVCPSIAHPDQLKVSSADLPQLSLLFSPVEIFLWLSTTSLDINVEIIFWTTLIKMHSAFRVNIDNPKQICWFQGTDLMLYSCATEECAAEALVGIKNRITNHYARSLTAAKMDILEQGDEACSSSSASASRSSSVSLLSPASNTTILPTHRSTMFSHTSELSPAASSSSTPVAAAPVIDSSSEDESTHHLSIL